MNEKNNSNYWRDMKLLQEALNNNKVIEIPTTLKKDIVMKIEKSLTESNYLVAKLLIYGQVTKSTLLNFLFYISVNTKSLYNLFIDNPDKFCSKFMFNITPDELPKFASFYSEDGVETFEKAIDLQKKVAEIKQVPPKRLQLLFPKSYKHNIKTNPFLNDNKL